LIDAWVGIEWNGKILDKAAALAELKLPVNSLDTIEMGPMKVRQHGSRDRKRYRKSTETGKDTSGKYIWTDVFVKENGKWRAVSSQSTKVPK
jgi:hypothetical protein